MSCSALTDNSDDVAGDYAIICFNFDCTVRSTLELAASSVTAAGEELGTEL